MGRADRFKRRALRRGYKVDEVDEFMDRCEATLSGESTGDPVTPEDVRDVVFRTRWGGYDEWQVDLHLDRLERELVEMIEGAHDVRGSNGFPNGTIATLPATMPARQPATQPATVPAALPPAARDVVKRPALQPALPPPPTATVYASANTEIQPAIRPDMPGAVPLPEPAVEQRQAARRPEVPVEAPHSSGVYVGAAPPSRATDGFSDLADPRDDYDDPFADHTPKPSFRENFSSTQIMPPAVPGTIPSAGASTVPEGSASLHGRGGPVSASVPTSAPQAPAGSSPAIVDPYAGRHGKADMTVELPAYGGSISPFTNNDKARLTELRTMFKLRRFGSGYDQKHVDRLFDAITAAMDGQGSAKVTDADFDPAQFPLVQGGYFEDEVEAVLAELRELFKRRMG